MECKNLPNHGYVEGVLKKSEREYLWSLIGDLDGLTEKNYGMKVSVQKQLEDKDNYFSSNVLMQYCQEYMNTYGVPFLTNTTHSHDFCMNRFWARISLDGDYQSIHDHQSVFTFVIWLKIPFDGNKERSQQPGFRPEAGDFCLVYTDTTGRIQKKNFILTPEMEGTILVFPSSINHIVYPHYSTTDYRVAVAGDITLSSLAPHDQIGTPLK